MFSYRQTNWHLEIWKLKSSILKNSKNKFEQFRSCPNRKVSQSEIRTVSANQSFIW